MTVATFLQTNFSSQSSTVYKGAIDGNFAVLTRQGVMFAPSESSAPNMTVALQAGHVFDGVTLTEVTTQLSTTIAAPATNPRIDRIVIDQITGTISVVTGTPAVSPTAPAIPAGKCPVAQIALASTTASITDSLITDERDFTGLGSGATPPPYGVSTNATNAYSVTTSPSFSALTTGRMIVVKINATNSGSATLNVNGIGAKTIKDSLGSNLTSGALIANSTYFFIYDGTNMILINSGLAALLYIPQTFSGGQRVAATALADSSGTTTVDLNLTNNFTYTLTANTTLNFTNVSQGQSGQIIIIQASSAKTVGWDAKQGWGGVAPTVSTGAGVYDALFYSTVASTQIITTLKKAVF